MKRSTSTFVGRVIAGLIILTMLALGVALAIAGLAGAVALIGKAWGWLLP